MVSTHTDTYTQIKKNSLKGLCLLVCAHVHMMYVWGRVHVCNGMYVEVREFLPEVRALWF